MKNWKTFFAKNGLIALCLGSLELLNMMKITFTRNRKVAGLEKVCIRRYLGNIHRPWWLGGL